jgi:threonine dehydrogenase-like Zn-dependent dehydrogenase
MIRASINAGGMRSGEIVVVQGTGPVGLFAIAWAAAAGCYVVAIGSSSNPARMDLAEKLGAHEVWDYRKTTADDRLKAVQALAAKLDRGDGADVVIEASGAPSAIPEGMALVRTLGRYIVPGQYSASGSVEIEPQMITFKAMSIIGSGQYTIADIGEYISFLRNNPGVQKDLASTITHRYKIADANEALSNASAGVSVKGVFVP